MISSNFILTICIPTYNRPRITLNLVENLPIHPHVEYIVVDDGSSTEHNELLKKELKFINKNVCLYYKPNGGKLSVVRYGLQVAKGKFYMDLDSDDWFNPDYLNNILETLAYVENLNKVGKNIIGIAGVCINKNKEIEGCLFPQDNLFCNYLEMRANFRVSGNKEEVVLTSALKKLVIKSFEGEKPMTPVIQWFLLGHESWLFVNKTFSQKNIIDTNRVTDKANWFKYIWNNKNTVRQNYKIILQKKRHFNNFKFYCVAVLQYIRFSLHGAKPFFEKKIWQNNLILMILLFPFGFLLYQRDRVLALSLKNYWK